MAASIRLVLVLHNHQPIGNFENVFEQAYQDSYQAFLDVFDRYPGLKLALHTSGSLMEWLDERHPEYVDRLAGLVEAGRVEILGGARFEPILSMIPARDRVGQITSYSEWLQRRLGAKVRGMWIPERVWEPNFPSDLAAAGIEYTLLDDFHFRNGGLTDAELNGYYLTEDDGHLVGIFPGSEQLRYLIPFGTPDDTINHLAAVAREHPNSVVVFGDDGEKFGGWPHTKKHVFDDGWLIRFFDRLQANSEWLKTTTLAEAFDNVPPQGKVYLPESSYREMTEWALPFRRLLDYVQMRRDMKDDPRWPAVGEFVRGGFWRNFKVKYPEADEMYARMMMVSRRLRDIENARHDAEWFEHARTELYRAQCNCSYWHGAFGGIYLPHLRGAVYNHLIAAENLLDRAEGRAWEGCVEAVGGDFNLDARQEVRLANDEVIALVAPHQGGQLYELDIRPICHNLLATLSRRPEAYHRAVLNGPNAEHGQVAGVQGDIVFKQEGLDKRLQYDAYSRKSLLDHFYDNEAPLSAVAAGKAMERGDFLGGIYEARLRRNPDRVQVQMTREGNAWGHPLKITKGVSLAAGESTLEIAYLIEGLPPDRPFHFAVEFNFAGLPADAEDRYFHTSEGDRLGHLGVELDRADVDYLGMTDEWLGLDVGLGLSRPSGVWTFPIATVSQSEGGFELVHQSVVVMPHWIVTPDASDRWSVTMQLSIDAGRARLRAEQAAAAAT